MKSTIISAALGLGLLALAGSASALTFNEVENGSSFVRYFSVTPSAVPLSTLGAPLPGTTEVLSLSGLKSQFSALSFTFVGVPGLTVNATTSSTDPNTWLAAFNDRKNSLFNLAKGTTYQVKVTGTTFNHVLGDQGTVSLSSLNGTLAPIPEPETYAMMLAGLGMLGFMAQRRKRAPAV